MKSSFSNVNCEYNATEHCNVYGIPAIVWQLLSHDHQPICEPVSFQLVTWQSSTTSLCFNRFYSHKRFLFNYIHWFYFLSIFSFLFTLLSISVHALQEIQCMCMLIT